MVSVVSVWLLLCTGSGLAAPIGSTEEVTAEISQAKQEFIQTLDSVLDGYLADISPAPIGYTAEVREAREEFFRVFNKAVDGMIEAVFESDEEIVREKKEQFLKTFALAVDDLFSSVEGFYTKEQLKARENFHQAYLDAEAGKVGAQYLPYTPEVAAARERFFRFFQFVVDGMLDKLSPQPGHNKIPAEIADFYIKDESEVAEAKASFDELYRNALAGDLPSAIALVALEEAVKNNDDIEGAAEELDETLSDIIQLVGDYEDDSGGEK